MTIQTNTTDRKALARAIGEELGLPARYMGIPTYAYRIGGYTVDRYGNIIGEDFEPLREFLGRNGYTVEAAPADPDIHEEAHHAGEPGSPEDTRAGDVPADSGAQDLITTMDISIPAEGITPAQLKNLAFMLYSRQAVINRMTRSGCLGIPGVLIDRLRESTPETPEAFTALLDEAKAAAGLTGFDFRDGKVSMTFPFDEAQPERWTTYAGLLNRIYDAAVKATRVSPEQAEPTEENEKYLAHTWLQRLGYGGADSKAGRKILLGHLHGCCAFSDRARLQAHKDKYAAIRRERRAAAQEAAAPEVVVEEGRGNE